MRLYSTLIYILSYFLLTHLLYSQQLDGELKKWHKITLNFDGPEVSENDEYNPFYNYRLDVTFSHAKSGKRYVVPGYFAGDGNSANTGATSGNKWFVHFRPDEIGDWTYDVAFSKGKWVAVRYREKGRPTGEFMDGQKGTFTVKETDKSGVDFRAHGRLEFVEEGYLKFAGTKKYFYKCGPDSPENFLAYAGFDGDFASDGHQDKLVKDWQAHADDWQEGNPTWRDGEGKGIIGALNYLSSKGMNSVSFLTNNIKGDDQNVFPYVDYDTYDRFDISKLAQWDIVFDHAQKQGIFLHFKTLEAENQGLLDNGGIGSLTKLYYRELIARFGHHLALNWNLCEEVGDWWGWDITRTIPWDIAARKSLTEYIYSIDPYHHHMVIHNGEWYTGMYGEQSKLTGASLQTDKEDFSRVHGQVLRIIKEAKDAGKTWAVACDEPGDASHSLTPDSEDEHHFNARTNGLWGAMLAGAWGTEWYFGYKHPHSDLSCTDYRSRDKFWEMGKACVDFFVKNDLPVHQMVNMDQLISSEYDYCYALPGETYVVLLKNGGESRLNLQDFNSKYSVRWYNPRTGGELKKGSVKKMDGTGFTSLGMPPSDHDKDWVILIRKSDS